MERLNENDDSFSTDAVDSSTIVNDDVMEPGTDRYCANCKTTVTPLWRKFGPIKFLCNACGLYWKVNGDHRPYYMSKNKLNLFAKKSLLRCVNCGTNKTTMWRKNGSGLHLCNACGLYIRINGHNRPVTMRKDIIRTRRRRDVASFEILEKFEDFGNASSPSEKTLVANEDPERDGPLPIDYKMMLNLSREHHTAFSVLSSSNVVMTAVECNSHSHLHNHHHNHHMFGNYAGQHISACQPEISNVNMHNRNHGTSIHCEIDSTLQSSQAHSLMNTCGPIQNNSNHYYSTSF